MSVYEYKGYIGSAEVDIVSSVLVGKLLFIRDSIAYSAETPKGLEEAFHEAVDDYLQTCDEHGDEPEVPCKGSFNVRMEPELHRRCALAAREKSVTLNLFVTQALEVACGAKPEQHMHVTLNLVEGLTSSVVASTGGEMKWEAVHGHTTH